MKLFTTFLSMLIIGFTMSLKAQDSPIATLGTINTSATTATVPITVVNFNNIGSCSLKILYDPAVTIPTSVTAAAGMGVYLTTNMKTPGVIILGWFSYPTVTLSNGSAIFNISFTKVGNGKTVLSFDDDQLGTGCTFSDGSFQILNDIPNSSYYIPGSLTFFNDTESPVTRAPSLTASVNDNINIPVTVTGFNNVGAVSLLLQYDPLVLSFNSANNTGGFPGLVINNPIPGTITVSAFSNNPAGYSLANNSVFFTINFTYLGGTTAISWIDDGESCEFASKAPNWYVLNDTPQSTYYINGSVGPDHATPTPTLSVGTITNPQTCGGNGTIPLTFTNVPDGTYTINYTSGNFPNVAVSGNAAIITAPAGVYNNLQITTGGFTSALGVNASLIDPSAPGIPVLSVTPPTCSNSNGSVAITSSTANLTFSFNGSAFAPYTAPFEVAAGAAYSIIARNSNLCVSPAATGIMGSQPSAPDKPTVSVIQPICSNANGSVAITSSTANLTFSFNGSAFAPYTAPFEVAAGAAYSIIARNSNLCVSPAATGIMGSQPSVPDKPTVSVIQPTCSNANGTVAITSSTANLTFSFNGQNYTVYAAPYIVAANTAYSITAKNNAGCVSMAAAGTMGSQPQSPLAPTAEVTQTSCSSGTGTITVSSDRTGLSFSLDGIDYTNTTGVFSSLIPNNYHVTSKNAAGCVSPQSALLTINIQPQALDKPIVGFIIHPTCTEATGSVELNDLPSTGSWSITRTPGDITTQGTGGSTIIAGLNPGTYNFTVSYAGCTSEASANVLINSQPLSVTPSVSIASNQGTTICSGTSVTFTATPVNGGTSPTYQWKVNDISAATGSTYTFVPENNDAVSCVMTSGAACATPLTVNSNTLNMTVSPSVTPSVSIASSLGTTICSGTSVTFTATPVNGGTSPAYQWKVNDINAATGSTYTFVPGNNDAVSCVMTPSAACATPATVNSNTLTMTVNPMMPVSVSIVASANPVNPGVEVMFTASPTNGGINPVYQWKVNGENEGTNHSKFSYVPQQGDIVTCSLTSSETCVSNNKAISNEINVLFIPQGTRELVYRFANPSIINRLGSDSFEFDVQVKASEAGTFLWSGQINLSLDNTTLSTDVSEWTVTKAGSFNGNNSLGNAKYNIEPSINGVLPFPMLSISYSGDLNALNRPATSGDFVEITTTYQTIFNIRGRILSSKGMAGIDFMESQMNGHQFYKLASAPWVAGFANPNEYDPADFMDTYVERVYCAKHLWTQVEALNWADAVNTSIWDGNATIPGGSLSNASALRIHNSASLTIPVDASLTVSGNTDIKTANGLIIQSNVTGTGSLITATASGDGSVIAQRYMTNDAWHIVSSPLSGQSVSHFLTYNANIATSGDDAVRGMMDYNPALNDWNDYFTNATTGNLETGKGFCMRTNANSVVSFNGLLQAGNQSATNLSSENWNSVGNPYTSAIGINKFSQSAANFLSGNIDNFDPSYGAIYVWDKPDASNGLWGKYTIISNTPTDAPFVIQQGQAFMIKVNTGVSSVNFNSGMQIHEPALALKSTKDIWPTIKLKASVNSFQVSTILAFNNEMTKGLDPTYDAGLFKGTADLCIYSHLVEDNGIPFAIQALPAKEYSSLIIPIGLNCKAGGEVVFSSEIINLPSDCKVILEDKQNKIFTDLSQKNYVTTIASNINIDDRFYLHTSNQTTGRTNDPMIGKMSAYAIRNVELIINAQVTDQAVASLYDVLGRLVLTRKLEADSRNSIKLSGIRTGIYILYVRDNGKEYGFKIPVVE